MPSIASAPLRFRERSIDDYIPPTKSAQQALDAARRFIAGKHRYLVFVGPTGVGKTHLAAAAASGRYEADHDRWLTSPERAEWAAKVDKAAPWERIRPSKFEPLHPDWQNVVDLIVGLREDFGRSSEDKQWEFRPAALRDHPGVLVLDDLGREKVSDWTGETVYGIVNHRYEAMLPTIVTTNLTGAELAASPYWPAISRLAEDGALLRIEAPDHRLRRSVA